MRIKHKLIEWTKRYGPAEIGGTLAVYIGYTACDTFTEWALLSAFIGAWAENIGFYGVVLTQRVWQEGKTKSAWRMLIEIITEFGPSELLDSFVLRPFCLMMGVQLLGPQIGLLLGKFASDIVFYVPVVATYEARKWWIRTRAAKMSISSN